MDEGPALTGLVDRVARAMCDGNWDAKNFNETMNGDEPEDQRDYWREKARAAIEAMRGLADDITEHPLYVSGQFSRRNIEAFVDAALSERSERSS